MEDDDEAAPGTEVEYRGYNVFHLTLVAHIEPPGKPIELVGMRTASAMRIDDYFGSAGEGSSKKTPMQNK
jgi:hypothetical protein